MSAIDKPDPQAPPLRALPNRRSFPTLRTVTALILREMVTTYGRNPGGYAWAVMEPAMGTVLISFIFSLGFFATPMLLGGGRVTMLAESVYVQVMTTANWGLGAALSLVLLAIVGLILWAAQRFVRVDDMAR